MRPANESEMKPIEPMVDGCRAVRVLSDKGYASADNRAVLKARGLKDGIMSKAARERPLSQCEELRNKIISKSRYRVERTFGTLKRRLRFRRCCYCGREKVERQRVIKAICVNLLKAVNKTKLVST